MKFTTIFRTPALILVAAGLPLAASAASSEVPGVGNFYKVDNHVYRGAQPTEQGFTNLAKLGIKTVIDLQQVGDSRAADEAKWVSAAGMKLISIPMKGMQTPSDATVAKVLALLEDSTTGPIFVHCHRGADRTGAIIASYRIQHDGWDNQKALKEAKKNGMAFWEVQIHHYVRDYKPTSKTLPMEVASGPSSAATLLPATAN